MPKRISITILSLLAAVLVAAGCGGSDSLSTAEFIQQSDEICRKAEAKKEDKLERFLLTIDLTAGHFMTQAEQEHQTKDIVMPAVSSMTEQINDLSAPEEEQAKVDALVKSLHKAIKQSEEESEKKSAAKSNFVDPFEDAAKLSRQLGFKLCFINY